MWHVERKWSTAKISVDFILWVASICEFFQCTVEDEVFTSSKAKDILAKSDEFSYIDPLTKYLVALLERLFATRLKSNKLSFIWLKPIILLINANVIERWLNKIYWISMVNSLILANICLSLRFWLIWGNLDYSYLLRVLRLLACEE